MSRERGLLSSIIDMLERSNISELEYAILDGETVYVSDLIDAVNKELDKPLSEPVKLDEKMLQHFTCEKIEKHYEGAKTPCVLYYTKIGAHQTYQLYENEAKALWHNLGKALGYAEPQERKTLSDDEWIRLETLERICAGVSQDMIDGGFTVKGLSAYAKSLEDKLGVKL